MPDRPRIPPPRRRSYSSFSNYAFPSRSHRRCLSFVLPHNRFHGLPTSNDISILSLSGVSAILCFSSRNGACTRLPRNLIARATVPHRIRGIRGNRCLPRVVPVDPRLSTSSTYDFTHRTQTFTPCWCTAVSLPSHLSYIHRPIRCLICCGHFLTYGFLFFPSAFNTYVYRKSSKKISFCRTNPYKNVSCNSSLPLSLIAHTHLRIPPSLFYVH
jgi:hypothetical protein